MSDEKKVEEAPVEEPLGTIQPGEDRSPEGGYAGLESEREAAEAALVELEAPQASE